MPRLSQQTCAIWAKTGTIKNLDDHLWEPLFIHMADSAEIARILWRKWLPNATKTHIASSVGLSESDAEILACWLAGTHDIGKATPAFQGKVRHRAEHVSELGLKVPQRNIKNRAHASMGQALLQDWLTNREWAPRTAATYTSIIGSHHGSTPNTSEIDEIASLSKINPDEWFGDSGWASAQNELLAYAYDHCGLAAIETILENSPLTPSAQVLFVGLVIVSDWIASNPDYFPLICDQATSWEDCQQRAILAWDKLSLPAPMARTHHASEYDAFFRQRFPDLPPNAKLHPAQEAAIRAASELENPGLIIIEAPMGSGKTEAALICAEILANKFGAGGVACLLPTMATSNAMFGRVHKWLETICQSTDQRAQSLRLMHSKAELNEEYTQLKDWHPSWMGDDRSGGDSIIAHQWFGGRKRGLLASFVVGTVDQLLMAALNARHVHLRHLGLAGKIVIVDEVHAYDAYMNAYLERSLQFLGQHGVPTILLSATLPESRRSALIKAYRTQNPRTPTQAAPRCSDGKPPYPLISTASRNKAESPVYTTCKTSGKSTAIELEYIPDDEALVISRLSSLLAEGGCACVIRNTVSRAQATYVTLRESLDIDIVLVHSRFIGADRIDNDSRLLELLGPDSEKRPGSLVVVGTQVIEQSLDIDFDVMITDIAPMDLLLQRMGRLHRHQRGERQSQRPTRLQSARCVITGVESWEDEFPTFAAGIDRVYHPAVLWQTIQALRAFNANEKQALVLPEDIAPLIESVYENLDERAQCKTGNALAEAAENWSETTREKKGAATHWLLQKLKDKGSINNWMSNRLDHEEDTRGRAAVRDSEESLEVVIVRQSNSGPRLLPRIAAAYHVPEQLGDDEIEPNADSARVAAMCTVALPMVLSMPWRIDEVIATLERATPRGWQQSHWLKGLLPLAINSEGEASIECGKETFTLRYTQEKGLEIIERKEEANGRERKL